MIPDDILAAAERALEACRGANLKIVTAESCTGGLIAGALSAVAGSSDVVDRGFVTYSNDAKTNLIGVLPEVIQTHGAVSGEVAAAMVEGARQRSAEPDRTAAVAVTGIAGPGGGSPEKPVGLVYLAVLGGEGEMRVVRRTYGDVGRGEVRRLTVLDALELLRVAAA